MQFLSFSFCAYIIHYLQYTNFLFFTLLLLFGNNHYLCVQIVCKFLFAHRKRKDMFNYSNNGVTVASIIDDRRATIENLYPVKIRITYKRVRKYYATGKMLSIEEWEKIPDTKRKSLIATRADIQNSFEKIKNIVQELEYENGFSFDALNAQLSKTISDTDRKSVV